MSSEADDVPPGFIIEDEEIIADFIVEAGEFLQQLDQDLIALEQAPDDLELLNRIFRAAHTIKGNASFLGFAKLTRFTHQTENVLDKLRSGEMTMNPEIMDLILESVDIMKALMDNLRDESVVDIETTLQKLEKCLKGELSAPAPAPEAPPPPPAGNDDMDEIIEDFIVESGELIEALDQDLLNLEQTPDNLDLLNQIFRPVHTIKGNASFLGFDKLMRFTHQLENLLDKLRSGDKRATPEVIDVILESVDLMKNLMKHLQNEALVDIEPMVARLQLHLTGESVAPAAPVTPVLETKPEPVAAPAPPPVPAKAETPAPAAPKPKAPAPAAPPAKKKDPEESTIRVDVERLDALMNLAGELVIAKNRLQQFSSLFEERFSENELTESLMLTTSLISFITGQFQEAVMKTRMLPIRKVFSRVPRMVRDLARDTKKQVNLVMEGEDTELDKSVIEHIGDPLVHIIRNAVDHGLETPDERRKAGKDPEGRVFLSAYSEGNYIVIEIKDDGKGMDPHKIFKKAVEKGLANSEDSLRLSESEMLDFIFAPGFSTAETISNISGRGVGMNVVKENIMKLDGLIEIDSRVGEGSTFRIQLPLTMAIVPALLVKVQHFTYAIPLNNVVETLVVQPSEIFNIDQKQVIHLRDRFVSLVPLNQILGYPDLPNTGQKRYVIIVGVGEQRMGLLVDQLLGQEEVVIKSLGEFFDEVDLIAGATIMGDGSVVLILDIGHILLRLSRKTLYVN
ncbi:chemotaxis protein CheA [bacterium (Candidatus Blackallbacteria) CG17_big_fil_post_rev_8_21_14_2_50_48_46]|uniref:histidine kinase n=1 Tax=bacterium (Candidatus Blackallbacteria) CG17_big_fil_post_rev_8_21_14_2_50_48_46 TaxID=2014261 RepID=A0A2M7G0V8_9BACT|nr:MAG: chemotaxis protein CheA [bacterium (Candidatus Blackallbacteria) CG18_big_fil_WC_8_21_14_2_50_49_26]PIW15312.1 MAG: chemotaxis protein CheA [bacterium (Candidatus Blackallbacteria) CG17_big_fil_post_rev_8_21_14_2_50_48_46]PIW45178.1 MAG: chemotaxis protein CheA [bacterium (Candidatus Blackallbacteria) CG13_big_fil_rev_8_21_14_2_50_49_14]